MRFLLISALALMIFTSCEKYEEGPTISLVPRSERVENTWVVDRAYEDGEDVTSSYDQYELTLTQDGAATLEADYTFFGTEIETSTDGTWEFTNDEENISFDYEDDIADGTYQILKLTQDEFWLRKTGDDLELQLREQ